MTDKISLIASIAAGVALLVILLASLSARPANPDAVRVACVGDSITFGAGIPRRKRNSYPAQLAGLLGPDYSVQNFGVGGTTLLKRGDFPYWDQTAYQQALAFEPNIVVIKLGTNDSKPQNWRYGEMFVEDYIALVQSFQALESQPDVWLCTPVPAYSDLAGIEDAVIVREVIPQVKQVAEATGTKVVELYEALRDRPAVFPDGIHPDVEGAKLIAETVFNALSESQVDRTGAHGPETGASWPGASRHP